MKNSKNKTLKENFISHYTIIERHNSNSEITSTIINVGFRLCDNVNSGTWYSKTKIDRVEFEKKYLNKKLNVEIVNEKYPNGYDWEIKDIEVVENFNEKSV